MGAALARAAAAFGAATAAGAETAWSTERYALMPMMTLGVLDLVVTMESLVVARAAVTVAVTIGATTMAFLHWSDGIALRLRASSVARTESDLAVETSVNQFDLGSLSLYPASGRGAAAPAARCRSVAADAFLGSPLLPCS